MAKKDGPKKPLMERLLKNEASEQSSLLADSKFFSKTTLASTSIFAINIALSGSLTGGFEAGAILVAGESRTFKTGICLLNMKAFLDTHEDGVAIFYDNEFGASSLFGSYGIDSRRVIHRPFEDVEDLKHKVSVDLDDIEYGENVFMMIDSIGQAASRKEVEDAVNDKVVADMTRAKALNSFWRIVTPKLTMKNVPLFGINHSYKTLEMYAKEVMSGGNKGLLAANTVWFTSRAQIKENDELTGWMFKLKAHKSRYIKEGAVIPYEIRYKGGFNKYGGLFEIATFLGFIDNPKRGWYIRTNVDNDKSWRRKECDSDEFWQPLLEDAAFHQGVERLYKLDNGQLIDNRLEAQIDKTMKEVSGDGETEEVEA